MGKVLNIVVAENWAGSDWHDSYYTTRYLKYAGKFFVPADKIIQVIAEGIHDDMSGYHEQWDNNEPVYHFKDCTPSTEEIARILSKRGEWTCTGEEYHKARIVKEFDGTIKLDLSHDVGDVTRYHVRQIPAEKVGYLPVEVFYAPWKGAYTVRRCYATGAFNSYEAAESFNKSVPKLNEASIAYCRHERYVEIINKADLNGNEWFKMQKRVVKEAMNKKINMFNNKVFAINATSHFENIFYKRDNI